MSRAQTLRRVLSALVEMRSRALALREDPEFRGIEGGRAIASVVHDLGQSIRRTRRNLAKLGILEPQPDVAPEGCAAAEAGR
jgi:hypothetical protein